MAVRTAVVSAAILCQATGSHAYAQAMGNVSSAHPAVSVAHAPGAIVPWLGEAARLEGMRLAGSPAGSRAQSASGGPQHGVVKWGAFIGAMAGGAGGALQPTHSNGEYVLGNNRFTSTLALGGIGVGVGALVGLAIEKSRQ
jgi:hypothetical protein